LLQEKIDVAVATILAAIEEFDPIKVYALVSGGNDSTVMGHLALRQGPRVDAFVHINTGIGVEQTREYVREFSEWLEISLIEMFAPRTYEELVLEYGFPGPAAHRYMYSRLKERALRQVRKEAQDGQNRRVMFITGVRSSESSRRMGHVEPVRREGNVVWVAPIRDFEHQDIWDYRDKFKLPRNEVVDILHMSGECLCGAFSKPNELDWLAMWYPEIAERIRNLEKLAHEAGKKSCHWGPQSSKKIREAPGPLCSGCTYDPADSEQDIVISTTV